MNFRSVELIWYDFLNHGTILVRILTHGTILVRFSYPWYDFPCFGFKIVPKSSRSTKWPQDTTKAEKETHQNAPMSFQKPIREETKVALGPLRALPRGPSKVKIEAIPSDVIKISCFAQFAPKDAPGSSKRQLWDPTRR